MRYVRIPGPAGPRFGRVTGTHVEIITPHPFGDHDVTGERVSLEGLKLLAPVIPTKIVAVGRNYVDHAREMDRSTSSAMAANGGVPPSSSVGEMDRSTSSAMAANGGVPPSSSVGEMDRSTSSAMAANGGVPPSSSVGEQGAPVPEEPLCFLMPASAVIGPGDAIRIPTALTSEVHHEAELAVVIGRVLRDASPDQALAGILGYTCANDVTARDLQSSDDQWWRAKGMDTFLPIGPAITTDLDPDDVAIRCRVNGEVRQDDTTASMVRTVAELVSHISHSMTLLPTDVVLTGTPAGVGPIVDGDVVEVAIDGIGALVNPVRTR